LAGIARFAGAALEHDPEKAGPALDAGWVPAFRKDAQTKGIKRVGKRNLAAIERIVSTKYQRGAASNRQHPYVAVLFSDITESCETLDLTGLVRKPLPPAFHRLS
jgi:hypothetical protein